MKVKVLKKFKDKYSGKIHKEDDVLNIKKERFDEIVSVDASLVEVISEKKEKKSEEK